jgi:hypothetical protein
MHPPPNGVYTAFSFVGFAMCAVPFYWHLESRCKYSCARSVVFKKPPQQVGMRALACLWLGPASDA